MSLQLEQKKVSAINRYIDFSWASYKTIVDTLPFLLFLCLMAIVYIGNTHLAEKRIRHINKMSGEVRELRWNYMSAKSELMFQSKQSEVSKAVRPMGLRELRNPPKKLEIKE